MFIMSKEKKGDRVLSPVQNYEAGAVSKQILRILLSYVVYVNRTFW